MTPRPDLAEIERIWNKACGDYSMGFDRRKIALAECYIPALLSRVRELEAALEKIAAETYTQECCRDLRWDGDPRHEPTCCGFPTDGLSRSQEIARASLALDGKVLGRRW